MTLAKPAGPLKGRALVRTQIDRIGSDLGFTVQQPADVGSLPVEIQIDEPLKVFALGLSDITEREAPLDKARHVAWRYILRQGGKPYAAAEILQDSSGELRFSHFNRGPLVQETPKAMEVAQELAEAIEGDCELRELRVPALGTLSLWIRNGATMNDRLVPIAPPRTIPLQRNYPYTLAEFIRMLQPIAAIKLVQEKEQVKKETHLRSVRITGDALTNCLAYIRDENGAEAADQARESAIRVIRKCIYHYNLKFGSGDVGEGGSGEVSLPFKPTDEEAIPIGTNGLLYGKVQSGKTNATIAIAALAGLNGFRCIVVLTSDNVWLGKQTYHRFRDALLVDGPVIRHWEDWRQDPAASGSQLTDALDDTGILLVSTKNVKNLENLAMVLKKAGARNYPAIIIDDEADNASLDTNTARRTRDASVKQSEVFGKIAKIRKLIPNQTYLQVTATPQSLLLQGLDHPSRPVFCEVSEVGKGYIGGDLFFAPSSPYACLVEASELNDLKTGKVNPGDSWSIPRGLRLALCTFFLGYAQKWTTIPRPRAVYSALIHICHTRINQQHVSQVIRSFATEFDRALRGQLSPTKQVQAVAWLQEAWDELRKTTSKLKPLDALRTRLEKTLRNAIPEIINADNPNEEPQYQPGMNILVGGNRLGRGVTIEGLMVTYYGRDPKQKVMDTVHQHARMFGYRSELQDVTRLFTAKHILDAFQQIHEADEATRAAIGDDPANLPIKPVWVGTSLKPTRSNVLNPAEIGAISPGRAIYPADPKWKKSEVRSHTARLDKLLEGFKNDEEYHEVDIDFLVKVLKEMPSNKYPGYTWEDDRVQQVLEAMKHETIGIEKGRLNVRRGKNGKGLELERQDELPWQGFASGSWVSKAKSDYPEQPTLIVMMQRGGKDLKWDGQPVYLPTLVLPKGRFAFMFNYGKRSY